MLQIVLTFLSFLIYFCLYPLLFSLICKVKVPKLGIVLTVIVETVSSIVADQLFSPDPVQLTVWTFVGIAIAVFGIYFLSITFTDMVDKNKPAPESKTKYVIIEPCIFVAIFTVLFIIIRALNL